MLIQKMTNRINTKLLIISLIGVVTATALLTAFSSFMIRDVFHKRYEDKLQIPGHVFLARYTERDIVPYINKLKERENLAEESRQILRDRQYVLARRGGDGNNTAEYDNSVRRIENYIESLSKLKDDKYHTIKRTMLELHSGAGLRHFYVLADLGIPEMYIQIFDAVYQGEVTGSFGEDYGMPYLKSAHVEAEDVFKTGRPVFVMENSGGSRPENIYYSFMPIKDDYGGVVAVIGTEINMQTLKTELQSFLVNSITIIALGSFLLLCAMYLALHGFITKPIQKLTSVSREIAAGNIESEIPAWILDRKDEMGVLGQSYASVGAVLREMLNKYDVMSEAAMSGQLDVRGDPASLGGIYAQVVSKINDTLDVVGNYFDNIPEPLAIMDADYDIVYSNRQFKADFAGVDDWMIYRTMLETDENDIAALKEKLAKRLDLGDFSALAWFNFQEIRRCMSFVCTRVMRNGIVNGAIIAMADTTELVKAKDNALSANRAKSEFLSRVSHELRTPLNVILSMAKLGVNDKRLDDSIDRFNKIVTSSSHLSNIINDVLEMSRMESGKTEIRRAPMHIKKMMEDCVELMKLKSEENNNRLTVSLDPDIPATLIGDDFRLRQILINLMSNSVKFTVDGQISLSAAVTERGNDDGKDSCTIEFIVADTGIGMSDEFLKKAFIPFEQEDSFLSRRYAGSGLGLSICHNLAELMGGGMTAESELGKGSRFTFNIPFEIPEIPAEAETEETAQDTVFSFTGKRVLLVDDIEINRAIVCEVLSDTGVELEEACDGEEACAKFIRSPVGYYDCILMDIQMPKMDGYSASLAIRASDRSDNAVPIIAMTANALKEDIDRSIAAGMSDHIAKPIDFDVCMVKLKKWCDK